MSALCKKLILLLTALALALSLCAGCGASPSPAPDPEPEETDTPGDEPGDEPSGEPSWDFPDIPGEKSAGHYTFRPLVLSRYHREVMGDVLCDTWENLVAALMAGEDTFACPDQFTYDWVFGQFPEMCFPVLNEIIERDWDIDTAVADGLGHFCYKVPAEEAALMIADFAAVVEDVLDRTLQDDYSDFEKALALYLYCCRSYEYDYDSQERRNRGETVDDLTTYRLIMNGSGVCAQISGAYAYFLMQAGVDATTMIGDRYTDGVSHVWTYLCLNGRNYHADPTYGVSNPDYLAWFLMDDAQREEWDLIPAQCWPVCVYAREYPGVSYTADDDTFSVLWNGWFSGFDHEKHTLYYDVYGEEGEYAAGSFDYAGW